MIMRHNLSALTSSGLVFALALLTLSATQCSSRPAPNDKSSQLAALQKACDAGVLSPQECEQHRAQLASQSSSGASKSLSAHLRSENSSPDIFRDPAGHYSLNLPDGWNTIVNNGKVQFSSGHNWVTLFWDDVSPGAQASKVSHDVLEDLRSQFTKLDLANEDDLQVNGHPAHTTTSDCEDQKGRCGLVVTSVDDNGGHFLSLVAYSPGPRDQSRDFNGAFLDMARTIRFAGK